MDAHSRQAISLRRRLTLPSSLSIYMYVHTASRLPGYLRWFLQIFVLDVILDSCGQAHISHVETFIWVMLYI